MKRFFLALIGISLSAVLFAQPKTYFGIEIGYKGDLYHLSDDGDGLLSKPVPGWAGGITVGHFISEHFMVESGIAPVTYWSSVTFRDELFRSSGNALEAIMIPLRIKRPLKLIENRLHITPAAGIELGYNLSYINNWQSGEPTGTGGGSSYSVPDETSQTQNYTYEYEEYTNFRRIFPLINAGFSIDYHFRNGLQFSLATRYSMGLFKIIKQDVRYSIEEGPETEATYTSKGDNFQVLAGLHYPISNLWQNKKQISAQRQLRREQIEKQTPLPFYWQMTTGLTWNTFENTNPVIYGNEKVGNIFWDNDVLFSLNFGYLLNAKWGVETGLTSHLFSSRYYVEKEGIAIAGESYRTGGSGFLYVPIKLNYYYRMFGNRLAIVPSAGVTLMTHFQEVSSYQPGSIDEEPQISDDGTSAMYYLYGESHRERRFAVLTQAGIGIEYALRPRFVLTMHGDYSIGFKRMNRVHVVTEGDDWSDEGSVNYKGTHFALQVGFKVPFGA